MVGLKLGILSRIAMKSPLVANTGSVQPQIITDEM
jgi:hypothetical protein